MTRKEKEKILSLKKLKFELGLLLPSLSLMFSQYQAAIDKKDVEDVEDLAIANRLIKKIVFAIRPYKQLHKESLEVALELMRTENVNNTNVFLTGLSLTGFHCELKNRVIKLKVFSEISDLYDLLCVDADKIIVDGSNIYAESVLKKLQNYYGV